jgi:hypothetical protein
MRTFYEASAAMRRRIGGGVVAVATVRKMVVVDVCWPLSLSLRTMCGSRTVDGRFLV